MDSNQSESKVCPTLIVLAPLSDEVFIRGDLHNTRERGSKLYYIVCVALCHKNGSLYTVSRLLQVIQGVVEVVHLLAVIPKTIANKADVSDEFCGWKWLTCSKNAWPQNNKYR